MLTLLQKNIAQSIKSRHYLHLYLCMCGSTVVLRPSNVRHGTKSCGCLKARIKKHGLSNGQCLGGTESVMYKTWRSMKYRVLNPRCRDYKDYGGRGITISQRWMKFENFLEDMGERPPELTLDRINNDGPYCKENCRWATKSEQSRNQRKRGASPLTPTNY